MPVRQQATRRKLAIVSQPYLVKIIYIILHHIKFSSLEVLIDGAVVTCIYDCTVLF